MIEEMETADEKKRPTRRVRSQPLRIWVTPRERDILMEESREAGMPLSELVRQRILGDNAEPDGRTMRKLTRLAALSLVEQEGQVAIELQAEVEEDEEGE